MNTQRDEERARRRVAHGENRIPPAAAVLVAIGVYAALPGTILFTARFVIPGVAALLLVALIATNPRRMTRETRWSRWLSLALAVVLLLANTVSLGLLIAALTTPPTSGRGLLVGAMQVWVTNVIGFALLYWEIDRGGPVSRHLRPRDELPAADWRFSQDENSDTVAEVRKGWSQESGWIPIFLDYLYVSVTNSTAFSPTDTMPLSSRAKILMGLQGMAALLISLLVIARAVNTLGG
jgi:hypothetical protein